MLPSGKCISTPTCFLFSDTLIHMEYICPRCYSRSSCFYSGYEFLVINVVRPQFHFLYSYFYCVVSISLHVSHISRSPVDQARYRKDAKNIGCGAWHLITMLLRKASLCCVIDVVFYIRRHRNDVPMPNTLRQAIQRFVPKKQQSSKGAHHRAVNINYDLQVLFCQNSRKNAT